MEIVLVVIAFCLTFFLNLLIVVKHITSFKNTGMFFISISLIVSWVLMISIISRGLTLGIPDISTIWLLEALILYTGFMAIFKIKEALQ